MAHKKKKQTEQEIFLKAFRKANREIELERNQGKWVSTHQVWKNKKKYNRKRDRKFNTDYPIFYFIIVLLVFYLQLNRGDSIAYDYIIAQPLSNCICQDSNHLFPSIHHILYYHLVLLMYHLS